MERQNAYLFSKSFFGHNFFISEPFRISYTPFERGERDAQFTHLKKICAGGS